ncbi:MAG: hypothetical protein IJY05_01040 [Clostridia bacterium]|nr:hypothetical protein [Clostridia bacterium]
MLKKVFLNILLFLMAFMLFALGGCGEYKGISNGDSDASSGITSESGTSEEGETDGKIFSVTLMFNGKPLATAATYGVVAQWTRTDDIAEIHRAPFDESGYASVKGLNGNYQVSLEVPKENMSKFNYLYNPNKTKTTNGNRDIEITLFRMGRFDDGNGKGAWNPYEISQTGVYEVEIKSATDKVYCLYAPKKPGTYTIESWVDVNIDKVNPKMEMFESYVTRKEFFTVNDGGASGTFTKNFSHAIDMDESNFAADGNGQVVYVFAIRAEEIDGNYPVKIRFQISYKAPFSYDTYPTELIAATELNEMLLQKINELRAMPKETFISVTGLSEMDYIVLQDLTDGQLKDVHTPYRIFRGSPILSYILRQYAPSGTLKYPEVTNSRGVTYFDGSMFKYYDPEKYTNGDGFYHLYDEILYSSTDGFGPILYATITMENRFLGGDYRTLTTIENAGNKALSVAVKDENQNIKLRNHKIFLEGYINVLNASSGFSYFCSDNCTCEHAQIGSSFESAANPGQYIQSGVCIADCASCMSDCLNCPEELFQTFGYADVAVGGGVFPVTNELKTFLQQFAISQRYFMDGNGWAETHLSPTIDCAEADQWLFGCLYYL